MRVKAQADALKRTRKLYDFGVGEICSRAIPLPAEYRAELFQAVERGETQYSLGKGDAESRENIAEDLRCNFGLPDMTSEGVCVCNGPKDAIFKVLVATLAGRPKGSRRRVVTFAPFYEAFVSAPQLATGMPAVVLPPGPNGLPDPEALEAALASTSAPSSPSSSSSSSSSSYSLPPSLAAQAPLDIGAVIICSPNNPTGAVYSRELLERLAAVCRRYPQVLVISDETYRSIIFHDDDDDDGDDDEEVEVQEGSGSGTRRRWRSLEGGKKATLRREYFSVASALPEQAVVVGGLSKEFAGTGLRVGFTASHGSRLADAVAAVQGNASSCPK